MKNLIICSIVLHGYPPIDNNIQSLPHIDSKGKSHIASVTYFNDNENHGTAFYSYCDAE